MGFKCVLFENLVQPFTTVEEDNDDNDDDEALANLESMIEMSYAKSWYNVDWDVNVNQYCWYNHSYH